MRPPFAGLHASRSSVLAGSSGSVHLATAQNAAAAAGFQYFATTSQDCYAGNEISSYVAAGTCDATCSGGCIVASHARSGAVGKPANMSL